MLFIDRRACGIVEAKPAKFTLSGVAERYGTEQGSGELEQPHVTFADKGGTTTIAVCIWFLGLPLGILAGRFKPEGADDFLIKPTDPDELAVRLEIAERIIGVHDQLARKNALLAELARG